MPPNAKRPAALTFSYHSEPGVISSFLPPANSSPPWSWAYIAGHSIIPRPSSPSRFSTILQYVTGAFKFLYRSPSTLSRFSNILQYVTRPLKLFYRSFLNTVLPVKAAATSAENTSAAHDGQNKGKDDMEDYPDIDSDNDSRPSLYRLKKPNHFAKKLRNSEKAARKRLFPRPEEVRPRRNDTKKYLKVIIYEDYWLWKESVDGTHK